MLRLENSSVLNHLGQTIATVNGTKLVNLQGQTLASANDDGFETFNGECFCLEGDILLGPTGSNLATVIGGNHNERALAAAAYVQFCMDGSGI